MNRAWTPEEDATLLRLRSEKAPYADISREMDRTEKALDSRFRIITMNPGKARERMERRNLARRESRREFRVVASTTRAPDTALADREARLSAPRTLTATWFGDPAPGWSALDRKRQGVTA